MRGDAIAKRFPTGRMKMEYTAGGGEVPQQSATIFRRSHSQTVDDCGWSHEAVKRIPLASRMWIVGQTLGSTSQMCGTLGVIFAETIRNLGPGAFSCPEVQNHRKQWRT